jgi:hypothetical protein
MVADHTLVDEVGDDQGKRAVRGGLELLVERFGVDQPARGQTPTITRTTRRFTASTHFPGNGPIFIQCFDTAGLAYLRRP